jgi:hypothetical protein
MLHLPPKEKPANFQSQSFAAEGSVDLRVGPPSYRRIEFSIQLFGKPDTDKGAQKASGREGDQIIAFSFSAMSARSATILLNP